MQYFQSARRSFVQQVTEKKCSENLLNRQILVSAVCHELQEKKQLLKCSLHATQETKHAYLNLTRRDKAIWAHGVSCLSLLLRHTYAYGSKKEKEKKPQDI